MNARYRNQLNLALITVALLALSGCATIVGNPDQQVLIETGPSAADVRVTDGKGKQVYSGQTPTTLTLAKSDGSYWGGQSYQIHVSKYGHLDRTIELNSRPNAWYLGGNFIFGGLIGWFILDPLNGNMYTLIPEQIDGSHQSPAPGEIFERNHISIRLNRDVKERVQNQQ